MDNIIFKSIVGSYAYGTYIEGESDKDEKGVFITPINELINLNHEYQITINKDDMMYSLRRFVDLLRVGNPTALELLFTPERCILYKHKVFDILIHNRNEFLTKQCYNSFGKYALSQISKAKGLDKKMNYESENMVRKTPLDFCYVYGEGINGTVPLVHWLKINKMIQEKCGLVKMNNLDSTYNFYYDYFNDNTVFRGICKDDSNEIRVTSIPKEFGVSNWYLRYNKDGYTQHCKVYKSYLQWLENRNTNRYVDNVNHNQKIDSKNMLHCRRLIEVAYDIVNLNTIRVERPNADYLISIKKGKVNLDELLIQSQEDVMKLEELFMLSNLKEAVSEEFCNNLLNQIYKEYYGI